MEIDSESNREGPLRRSPTSVISSIVAIIATCAVALPATSEAAEHAQWLNLREAKGSVQCVGEPVVWQKLSNRGVDVLGFRQPATASCRMSLDVPDRSTLSFTVSALRAGRPARIRITARNLEATSPSVQTIYDSEVGAIGRVRAEASLPRGNVELELHCESPSGGRRTLGVDWSSLVVRTHSATFAGAAPWTTDPEAALASYYAERTTHAKVGGKADAEDGRRARRRMLVIGIDGASWDLLTPLLEAGELPALAALRARGRWGLLRSTLVSESAMAWTAISTGVNAGKSGIYMWFSPARGRRTFWQTLGDHGVRSLIVSVPKAFAHEPFPGVMIGGWTYTADVPFVHPPELQPYVLRAGYRPGLKSLRNVGYYADHMRRRTELTLAFMAREDWDLAFVVYEYPDTASHRFGLSTPEWRETQRLADAQVAALLEEAGDETMILVVSDHGWKTYPHAFRVKPWLLSGGRGGLVHDLNSGNVVSVGPAPSEGGPAANASAPPRDELHEVKAVLESVGAPNGGAPLVTRVLDLPAAFPGQFSGEAQNKLVVELREDHRALGGKPGEPIFSSGAFEHHASGGIYVLAGPGIAHKQAGEQSVMDVAATVLQYFGVASQPDADGVPLDDFGRRTLAVPGPAFRALGTAEAPAPNENDESLTEHLRTLGYIE